MRLSTNRYTDPSLRWSAVLNRDQAADGQFVYAVKTTGIFCRPSCASRRPLRENAVFFADVAAAAAAGFRPCRRCRPLTPKHDEQGRVCASDKKQADRIAAVCRRLENEEPQPSLQSLAETAGLSPWHLQRSFKQRLGLSPKAYAKLVKARRLGKNLEAGLPVTDALYAAGYGSASRAYEDAQGHLGMTPGQYANKGKGETISYACAPSTLGHVLVAGTSRGICSVEIGDSVSTLVARLRQRFANAQLQGADDRFTGWLATVIGMIDEPLERNAADASALPLDIRGTAFQQRVWQALRKLPVGATISYAELAMRIGRPGAARAVANACATNQIAVVIPCHRVIRADGALSGYRWGTQRKRALLEREGKAPGNA